MDDPLTGQRRLHGHTYRVRGARRDAPSSSAQREADVAAQQRALDAIDAAIRTAKTIPTH